MIHILLITPQRPYPPHQGTTLRNFNLVKELARRHSVCLLTFLEADQDPTLSGPLPDLCRWIATVPVPQRTNLLRLRQMLLTRRPDMSWRLWSSDFASQLTRRLQQEQFDIVEIEGIEMTPYLPIIQAVQPQPRIIYDAHNAEWILQKRACFTDIKNPKRWVAALYSWVQWHRLKRYEAYVLSQVEHTIAMSDPDRIALSTLRPNTQITVIPNGVDLDFYRGFNGATISHDIVFTGKMDFRPNIDAALWFGLEVLPRLQEQRPGTTFAVVGQRPHARLNVLRGIPGITITGQVDDIRPYIAGATVYVAPLRVGGGTRLKLLEAMAMSRPIVATTVGAEGFPVTDGQELFLADTPDHFGQRVLDLLQSSDLRSQLGQKGFSFARANYDWNSLVPQLEKTYHG